jgi:hypothetical protein
MDDPALTWAIFGLVWAIGLYREGYRRGLRAALAARPPAEPSPPIVIAGSDRIPVASEQVLAPPTGTRWVRVGGRTIVVDASRLTEP